MQCGPCDLHGGSDLRLALISDLVSIRCACQGLQGAFHAVIEKLKGRLRKKEVSERDRFRCFEWVLAVGMCKPLFVLPVRYLSGWIINVKSSLLKISTKRCERMCFKSKKASK